MFDKIYKEPSLLNSNEELSITPLKTHKFAENSTIVALGVSEIALACMSYPVVIHKSNGEIFPVALLSARDEENLFINKNGKFQNELYIPNFFNMYPFIAVKSAENGHSIVYDKSYKGINKKDSSLEIIKDGKVTQEAGKLIDNIGKQYSDYEKVKELMSMIDSMGLLTELVLNIPNASKEKTYVLKGFYQVDAQKVNKLNDKKLVKLAKNGALNIINFHLASLSNIAKISNRLID